MDECSRTRETSGFTLVELMIVMLLVTTLTGIAVVSLSGTQGRAAARAAAQHFSTDLRQARAFARRTNQAVTIAFDETTDSLHYTVIGAAGDTLADRRFRRGFDIRLDSFDLGMAGDTLRFGPDGIVPLDDAQPAGPTATARFVAGDVTYLVRFNSTGEGIWERG